MRVLVVEDDGAIMRGLCYSLEEEGFEVTACADVKSALLALTARFDLALLDLMLPDGSGYDICKKIRENYDTPVIFLSACIDEINVVMGLDMGADDYITKPFRVRELMSRIRTVLRRSGAQSDKIKIGCVTVDRAGGKVTKNGTEIPLSALEYRLLLNFASNKGQLLTRAKLLSDIWDISGEFVSDNTLSVYVARLRAKLEDDPLNPKIIKTVRGLGYKAGE